MCSCGGRATSVAVNSSQQKISYVVTRPDGKEEVYKTAAEAYAARKKPPGGRVAPRSN